MTSPDHRNCSERSNEVCQRLKADFIVEIQGDEPTLETDDLDRFVTKALEYSHFDVATQYTEITEEQANDPQNVKVVVGPDSRALFKVDDGSLDIVSANSGSSTPADRQGVARSHSL